MKNENGPDIKVSNCEKVMQSVVKLFVQMSTPNYCMPWQMKRQQQTSGSGFVIAGKRILTNAHVIAYHKSIRIRKHGDAKKYNAHVIHMAHECDIAMVGVADEAFWEGLDSLEFGDIPQLEEDVVVVGFPTGGDNISVTRGVVSRVDIQRYSHSGAHLLAIQIDAAINSGNSGGPAFKDGKVIGIAFETLSDAENIGYIIPTPVVSHFLADVSRNGRFSGFCNLGIRWQPIESEHMRRYFRLAPKQTGVLVSRILKLSCSFAMLQRGDILMALDGTHLADDGTVPFRGSERIQWNYLTHSKYPHEVLRATVLRAAKVVEIDVLLGIVSFLVPAHLYEKRPSYVVYSGLVFVSLSQPYMLHQYGKDWGRKAPIRLCDRILYGVQEMPDQEVVILSQVLASELTAGYDSFSNLQLYRVNGVPILNLRHLCHLLDQLTRPATIQADSPTAPDHSASNSDDVSPNNIDDASPSNSDDVETMNTKNPLSCESTQEAIELFELDQAASTDNLVACMDDDEDAITFDLDLPCNTTCDGTSNEFAYDDTISGVNLSVDDHVPIDHNSPIDGIDVSKGLISNETATGEPKHENLDYLEAAKQSKENIVDEPLDLAALSTVHSLDSTPFGRRSPHAATATPATTAAIREEESYVSFDGLAADDNISGEPELEGRGVSSTTDKLECRRHALPLETPADVPSYAQYTTATESFYYGAGDEPLLLDTQNYIHFELDKDKVIVFNIRSAFRKNVEILEQYAISSPRSLDLPKQPF